ncbi:MAG: hypothetical protein O2897_03860 [bacterium]|nr:hypothetical protein [bacterium]
MKKFLILTVLTLTFSVNAHFGHDHHDQDTNNNNDTKSLMSYVASGLGLARNGGEIYSHVYNLWTTTEGSEAFYHITEVIGHSANVAGYLDLTSTPVNFGLTIYNIFAAHKQAEAIKRNIHETGFYAKAAALFGSLDFLGHCLDTFYSSIKVKNAFTDQKTSK